MKKLMMALAGASMLALAAPAYAASEADCKAMWDKVDANKDGSAAGAEVTKYLDAIKASGKKYDANADGKLTQAEFMDACKADVFKDIKS